MSVSYSRTDVKGHVVVALTAGFVMAAAAAYEYFQSNDVFEDPNPNATQSKLQEGSIPTPHVE